MFIRLLFSIYVKSICFCCIHKKTHTTAALLEKRPVIKKEPHGKTDFFPFSVWNSKEEEKDKANNRASFGTEKENGTFWTLHLFLNMHKNG